MNALTPITLFLVTLLLPFSAIAGNWSGDLEDGSVIRIDPTTNKATRFGEQGTSQLWDGTHRMKDGTVVIVEDGIVTNRTALDSPMLPKRHVEPGKPVESSPCVELVVSVCGFNGQCADSPACSPARQLMELERDEAWQGGQTNNQTTAQCRTALADESFFKSCTVTASIHAPTACEKLVGHVCGAQNQCMQGPACLPAHQLLKMEQDEQKTARDLERLTYSSKKCLEAIDNQDFFTPCAPLPAAAQNSATPAH